MMMPRVDVVMILPPLRHLVPLSVRNHPVLLDNEQVGHRRRHAALDARLGRRIGVVSFDTNTPS